MKSLQFSRQFMGKLILLLLFLSPCAQAFQLSPLTAVLKPSGSGASQTFELENKSEKPIPIEVSVLNRTQDMDGKDVPDTSSSAEEKFVIYPPQFILEPKSVRSVKLTWIGSASITSEQAFRVNFQELAVPLEKEPQATKPQAKINLLLEYSASVYIAPPNASPKLTLVSAGPSASDPSKLEMLVENQGTGHLVIKGFSASLQAGNRTVKVSERNYAGGFEKNFLASAKLRILVPWPQDLPKGPISGEFVPKP